MSERDNRDFCIACRKNTEYTLRKKNITNVINGKKYNFTVTTAVCTQCGKEMSIPGLIDKNIKEVDEQYRICEDIVTIDDIEKLMTIYKIGKEPLSLALGFGQITIRRYLSGQMPSKEYSNVIKSALSSPEYMRKKLCENKNKLSQVAFEKGIKATEELKELFSVSDKMLGVIAYLFKKMEEVTPLMLQKLLYFTQGISLAVNKRTIFPENCQAWVHGPVYRKVYDMFKNFKYNPIDDPKFAVLDSAMNSLTSDECKIIDMIVNTYGEYSGKMLERITHCESPWILAREGFEEEDRSDREIPIESIRKYYSEQNQKYDFLYEENIKKYIIDVLINDQHICS